MRHSLLSIVFAALLSSTGSAQARVPDALLGRWIVVRLGGQPAHKPYKLWLRQDAASFPDDEKYGIARFELEAFTRESCFLAIDGESIVGPFEFQKRYPQLPYMLCTAIENFAVMDDCAEKADDHACVQHVIDDSAYLDRLFDARALKWGKARGKLIAHEEFSARLAALEARRDD